jgi:hypothetical protein
VAGFTAYETFRARKKLRFKAPMQARSNSQKRCSLLALLFVASDFRRYTTKLIMNSELESRFILMGTSVYENKNYQFSEHVLSKLLFIYG